MLVIILIVLFFFGEIAISFSDKTAEKSFIPVENLSFAMKLDNSDTDFEQAEYIDRLMITFLKNYNIPGASVAVTKGEKLVYAKGFGLANTEISENVQPGHLFRVASVSKLITAVAIMKLRDEGFLTLSDKAFGAEGILNEYTDANFADERMKDIEIRHLLNHTAGWSRAKGDPVFNSLYVSWKMKADPPATVDQMIRFGLKVPLNWGPGKTYSYSNLGYVILGRIISRITGMAYEDYVVMNILKPLGINDMHIGNSLYHEKFPNEVHYFEPAGSPMIPSFDGSGRMVPKAYGGNDMKLLGAAGGWVASAPELARFLSAVDGFNNVRDILPDSSLFTMVDHEAAGKGLFGWRGADNYGTWWRTGTLSGSLAFLMRMQNGVNWVVLLNSSGYKNQRLHNKLSRIIFAATYRVKQWPEYDLFMVDKKNIPSPIKEIPVVNPEL